MGDRCYVKLQCRAKDKAVFEKLGFIEEYADPKTGVLQMYDEQANYAHDSSLKELAAIHLPFVAENYEGGDYGCAMTVSFGGRWRQIECLHGLVPAVRVNDSGHPLKTDMAAAKAYFALQKEALAALLKG